MDYSQKYVDKSTAFFYVVFFFLRISNKCDMFLQL